MATGLKDITEALKGERVLRFACEQIRDRINQCEDEIRYLRGVLPDNATIQPISEEALWLEALLLQIGERLKI